MTGVGGLVCLSQSWFCQMDSPRSSFCLCQRIIIISIIMQVERHGRDTGGITDTLMGRPWQVLKDALLTLVSATSRMS